MSIVTGRSAAGRLSRAHAAFAAFLFLSLAFISTSANAVIVRGVVTDALGRPIPGARVQLIEGQKPVAASIARLDGSYEIRSTEAGRFVLLAASPRYFPAIGQDFYGGATDILTQNVVLETNTVQEDITVTATGTPTPIQQSSSAITLFPESDLVTRAGVVDVLRLTPGMAVVQSGQYGGVTSLFVRGGNSDANKVLIDGIPAEDVGGRFDFGTVSSTAIGPASPTGSAIEVHRGPDSVLYGSDAAAGVISFTTPRGTSPKPVIVYSGDAGNLHTYRNEVSLSGAHQRLDYFAAFSRFNTSNALPMDEYHSTTAAANIGFSLSANTIARFTIRNADSASGLPGAHDFYGISAAAKQGDQDLYSGLTLEHSSAGGWHNLVRYGIARKREQATTFYPAGTFLNDAYGGDYYGNTVTIRGANGYTATGRAIIAYACYPQPDSCFPQKDYSDSNRDELYYQSDYIFPGRIAALFGFRYEDERGSFVYPTYYENQAIQRTNFEYTLQFSGDIRSRVFYSLGGAIEKNHLYGMAGTPRFGLTYVPAYAGAGWFHGTRIRASASTGVQEPSLSVDYTSLYTQLLQAGNTAAIQSYGITPIKELRTRALEFGVDQNIWSDKLILKAGYFHNQYSHQIEYVDSGTLKQYFGITGYIPNFYGADINSLAFRAQGIESEIDWRPSVRYFFRAGYTYLDAVVEQSFSSDAIAAQNGYASENPNIPGIPIGESPFVGARPFRRPPHTGFFTAQYTGAKLTAALNGAFASKSDDSTFLDYSDLAGTDSMILPNRNLDFGYLKLDGDITYAIRPRVFIFTQLDNLLNNQHIGPIGYPGLPFTVRAGLKVRIGGE